jgi:thioredoxin-related protein
VNSRYLALILILVGMVLIFLTPHEGKVSWKEFDRGVELSKASGKYMLIYFHSETCSVCKAMDREVLSDKKIVNFIELNFIPVKVDANAENSKRFMHLFKDRNESLVVPFFIIMSPDGKVMGYRVGYVPKEEFFNFIRDMK